MTFAYPYYVLPIIFPSLVWMGLGQVMFGMAQLVIHGIVINRKLHSIYNPGLFAVIVLHLPIGTCYIWYVIAHGLAQWWMWPGGHSVACRGHGGRCCPAGNELVCG